MLERALPGVLQAVSKHANHLPQITSEKASVAAHMIVAIKNRIKKLKLELTLKSYCFKLKLYRQYAVLVFKDLHVFSVKFKQEGELQVNIHS